MIALQALGALVLAAAATQAWLLVSRFVKSTAREQEQRRLSLALLEEKVLAASRMRQFEEARQTLSWSGYRKFLVARKVYEDAPEGSAEAEINVATTRLILDKTALLGREEDAASGGEVDFRPKLVQEGRPEVYTIEGEAATLGRKKDCDIVIDNVTVSSRHARIFRKGQSWYIEDLESSNGTYVNMAAVRGEPVELHRNDHIRLAAVDLRILLPAREAEDRYVPQICSLYLVPHDGKPLPPFQPGQYLTFQLRIPSAARPVIRCYSLSDCANPEYYRITVKRVPPPRDKPQLPPGLSSGFLHDQIQPGDILDVQAPRGGFAIDPAEEKSVVLIGGGIGVTPVLTMLNAIVASDSKRETWFFYGVRNTHEHIMKEHLNDVARQRDNVKIHVCHSDPTADSVQGRDYDHGERVTIDLLKRLLPSNNYEFYICGPPPMMNQLTSDLLAWGVPESSIHYEAFGPATVKRVTRKEVAIPGAATFKVTFARSSKECVWDPAAASLLDFAAANGVQIDSGCRAGNCGTCITAVRSGDFSYTIEPGAPAEPGTCLTCISVPKADLVLDA